ncbi:MAG: hypothetical protein AAB573_01280 [Patescibacteria group bacterium]
MSGETLSQLQARDIVSTNDALDDARIERIARDMQQGRKLLIAAKTETKRKQFAEIVNYSHALLLKLLGRLPPGRTQH